MTVSWDDSDEMVGTIRDQKLNVIGAVVNSEIAAVQHPGLIDASLVGRRLVIGGAKTVPAIGKVINGVEVRVPGSQT